MAAAIEYATGQEAIVLGKPDLNFFKMGAHLLGREPSDVIMIGTMPGMMSVIRTQVRKPHVWSVHRDGRDDIRGDVAGAQEADMQGVLVKTGKFTQEDLELGVVPDAVLNSIADFPACKDFNNAIVIRLTVKSDVVLSMHARNCWKHARNRGIKQLANATYCAYRSGRLMSWSLYYTKRQSKLEMVTASARAVASTCHQESPFLW
eukprot:scaffold180297_cov25-Prasinocladus_malaysianus.AAC.1